MTYNTGTSTSYLDFLVDLIEVVTSSHISAITLVTAAGADYEVSEILNLDGSGTFAPGPAQIEVLTVNGSGGVLTARVYRGGAYTVAPDLTATATVTTGFLANGVAAAIPVGAGATFNLTFAATGWTQLAHNVQAATATPIAGTGYIATEVLTLVGGVLTNGGTAATFTVNSVTVGVPDAVTVANVGSYEVPPASPVTTTSSGSGTGCTLTLVTAEITASDTIVVLKGEGGSALDPLVGIKTYSSENNQGGSNPVSNFALFGMSAWSSISPLHQQANVSPGFNTSTDDGTLTLSTSTGAFVPLKPNVTDGAMEWKIRATARAVVFIVKVVGPSTTYYAAGGFGLLNQFGITSEVPFPAFVIGSSDRKQAWFRDTNSIWGGLSLAMSVSNGPMFAWSTEGSWIHIKSGVLSSLTATTPLFGNNLNSATPRATLWPVGESLQISATEDKIWDIAATAEFDNGFLTLTTASRIEIYRTPDSSGDGLFPLFPVTAVQGDLTSGFFRVFGEIDGVFWFSDNDAGVSSEDRFTQVGVAHSIYQNGTQVDPYAFMALRED